MPRIALSISILLLLFAGTFATIFANHSMLNPSARSVAQAIPAGDTRVGIDCGLGTTQAVANATGFPVAPSENDPTSAVAQTSCTWNGDAGQTSTGSNDGTTEPLVTDQDESLSLSSGSIGSGFTASVIVIQNRTAIINGFDLQLQWNPAILHAVEFDQQNIPAWTPNVLLTPVRTIDNTNGVAELAQVISSSAGGNFTLFRIRFDVIGVGVSNLHPVDEGGGLANPGLVVHSTIDGAFDSETFFDPGHSLTWNATFAQITPISPGGSNGFIAQVTGGTGPYTYAWQFDSCNQSGGVACTFNTEATGNPAFALLPSATITGYRVAVNVTDSLGHVIQMVRQISFTANLRDVSSTPSNSFPVNTPQLFNASWIGGIPPYTGSLRLCPGTTSNNICTLPNTAISGTGQNVTRIVTYKLAGVYTDTLSVTDSTPAFANPPAPWKNALVVNVTGAPKAYNVTVAAPPTNPQGSSVTISAHIAYNSGYPTNLEATRFAYTISFGDGATGTLTGGPSITTSHMYFAAGNHTIRIIAQESGSVSQIQEVGYGSTFTQPSTGFNYSLSINPAQANIVGGQSTTASVSVTSVNGTAETVGLHAIYSIPGVSIAFSLTSGTPSYSSTMTVTTQTSTPNGSYSITIVGNSTSGVVRQATFMLLVGTQSSGRPIIGVFSTQYGTANITDTSLVTGSKFHVQVNVTNSPSSGWNAYEFALYYDQRYINVTSYDLTTNTVFPSPYISPGTTNVPGALRLSIVNLGVVTVTTGMLVDITFTVVKSGGVSPLILAPGMAQPGQDAGAPPGICPQCPLGAPNWSHLLSGINYVDVATTNGYFNNAGGNPGPVASFTYSPANPAQGEAVTFNAASSYDPDNSNALNHGILKYMWDFGTVSSTGNATTSSSTVTHVFSSTGSSFSAVSGNFTVRLTVIDSDNGFEGMAVLRVTIVAPVLHDVAVNSVNTNPHFISQGGTIQVIIGVSNFGTTTETFNLTVVYGPSNQTALHIVGLSIPSGGSDVYLAFVHTGALAPGNYNLTAIVSDTLDTNTSNNALTTLFQVTPPDEPPVAIFNYSPANPVANSGVSFNATASFDPDGTITSYRWDFGDGTSTFTFDPFAYHIYGYPGNFTATLTLTDSDSQTASTSMIVHVQPRPAHDVMLIGVFPYPTTVVSGQTVNFQIEIQNIGTSDSSVNTTIYYGGKVAVTQTNLLISSGSIFYFDFPWTTTGVAAGNYTISATVFLPGDPTPGDNSYTDDLLTILPPPVLSATPNSGPTGTMVTLHGTGFPSQYQGLITNEFEITFDNQFIGYAFGNNTFTFTLNIPLAQAGTHSIHAVELYPSFLDIQTTFTVTAAPGSISVSVTTGTVYFPGDTATIFIQTSLNGSPTTVTSLQAILIKPGNTNTTLKLTLISIGVYRTTYTVPSTGPILGTYAIIVKAHQTGANDAQSLTTFEVKLSWLASQSKNITAGIAITGLVGVAALAWRKGYFRRKDSEEETQEGSISDAFASP